MFQQTEAPTTKLTFFLVYFACPHYQENGGWDVAALLGFESTVSEQDYDTLGTTFNLSLILTSRKMRRSP